MGRRPKLPIPNQEGSQQMKIPIWIKDPETGKYERCVPMQVFPDGRVGFFYALVMGQGDDNPYWQFYRKYNEQGKIVLIGIGLYDARVVLKET
jgi:hypothetical protein